MLVWKLSNLLWRSKAIAIIAPHLAGDRGQASFAAGLAAFDPEEWWHERQMRDGFEIVVWRSLGHYRDFDYSVRELLTYYGKPRGGQTGARHRLAVGVRIPVSFQGTLDIQRHSGLMTLVDGTFRKLAGSDMQRRRVDEEYDRHFDTITTEDAPLDLLLTPAFRDAMLALGARHRGLIGRFQDGWFQLYLHIPEATLRNARLTVPMTELRQDAERLTRDLTTPHRLIDLLMGDHDTPLR